MGRKLKIFNVQLSKFVNGYNYEQRVVEIKFCGRRDSQSWSVVFLERNFCCISISNILAARCPSVQFSI
jgi:hypothetical protein